MGDAKAKDDARHRRRVREWQASGLSAEAIAVSINRWTWENVVRPGEPWTAADVRAVLEGGEGS